MVRLQVERLLLNIFSWALQYLVAEYEGLKKTTCRQPQGWALALGKRAL